MDTLELQMYELAFERDFLKLRGDAFQERFSSLMEKRYPGDFVRVRPWGNRGDEKNDGYLTSSRTIYQCYAPNELTESEALAKVEEDFEGAKNHWLGKFDRWVFVHNSQQGLGPRVLKKLIELREANPSISIDSWGFEEQVREFRQLDDASMSSLVGLRAPSRHDVLALGFADIRAVIETIQFGHPSDEADIREVPSNKLTHNRLSRSIEDVLRIGMGKSRLVESYLANHPNPELGDRIGGSLKMRYSELRERGSEPDHIFFELQEFVAGERRGTPAREAAVLAILAYFFEQCDIFERPPDVRA